MTLIRLTLIVSCAVLSESYLRVFFSSQCCMIRTSKNEKKKKNSFQAVKRNKRERERKRVHKHRIFPCRSVSVIKEYKHIAVTFLSS